MWCSLLLPIIVSVAFLHFSYAYKGCHGPVNNQELTIRLSKSGHCIESEHCQLLENCTIFDGSLIFQESQKSRGEFLPSFKKLREITGFLIVGLLTSDLFNMLPALSVIRGNVLVGNYALIIYQNPNLKEIYFPNLTTILKGGVRVAKNKELCYVNSVRWKSIVKDKEQDQKYGVVLKENNLDCDSSCYSGQCYAAVGHSSNPKDQFCWGLGNKNDYYCQKFCNVKCGLRGCVDGQENLCCSEECLGGCSSANSSSHCHACQQYLIWETGECVSKCPKDLFLVDEMFCQPECPGWSDGITTRQYSLNGECIKFCPEGFSVGVDNRTCQKCDSFCPRVCRLSELDEEKRMIKIPTDIPNKGLTGCTEVIGSLDFQIQEGTGNVDDYLKRLETIKKVQGHIRIKKSNLKNLEFFKNLEVIDPPENELIHGRYAISIDENKGLETLWFPRKAINVSRGQIFAQYNPRLCPQNVYDLQHMMRLASSNIVHGNVTGDVSEQTNGNRVLCAVNRLQIEVLELKVNSPYEFLIQQKKESDKKYIDCATFATKCIKVRWNVVRNPRHQYIIVYRLYYRKLDNGEKTDELQRDGADKWETVEILKKETQNPRNVTPYNHIISKVEAYSTYAIYLREVVSRGEERTSEIRYINISTGFPSSPLGFEATFLSENSIRLKWRTPDQPRGQIVNYNIYWKRSTYSFWEANALLNWCERDVKSGAIDTKSKKDKDTDSLNNTFTTCVCDTEKEQSIAVKEDRDAHRFLVDFKEKFNEKFFTKPSNKDENKNVKFPTKEKRKKEITSMDQNYTSNEYPKANATVDGDVFFFEVKNLEYFQLYEFIVCACTGEEGGCSHPKTTISTEEPCAIAQARTNLNERADDLGGPLEARVEGKVVNISWTQPRKPNAVVLKYDVVINYKSGSAVTNYHCRRGNETFFSRALQEGEYTAKVRAISPAGNGSWSGNITFTIKLEKKFNPVILGVSVGASVLIVILIGFIVYYAFFKRNFVKGEPGVLYASVNPEYMASNYVPDEWELNRETIELLHELGQGSFGMVYEGIAHEINGQAELRVAVKTVNENASNRERNEFLHEASIMKTFQSNHVVRLIGVVSLGQPTFVVMELMTRGDLKTFLRSRRPEESNSTLLPPMRAEMLQMTAEIADGMAYLAARKFVHRDLAARNCMVASDHTVKIGDFGMARDIYETDYYRKGGKGLLPVRWMAPESLRDGIFTTASDVWSFGVVLWEIVTLASQPYQGKSNEEVLKFVVDGGQLEFPTDCEKQLQLLMELCWKRDAKKRPSFLEVIRLLEDEVSEDFMSCSFYHEMKAKALEDALNHGGSLYELLREPNRTPNSNNSKKIERANSNVSDDSGTFIDSCKPEMDQSYNTPRAFPSPSEHLLTHDLLDGAVGNTLNIMSSTPLNNSFLPRENSMYDNLDK